MDLAFLIGRALFGGYFIYNGVNHFVNRAMLAQYASYKKVPAPTLAVVGAGVLILLGGLSVLTGFLPRVGVALIVLFLVGVTPKMHDFWAATDPNQKLADQVNFTKNVALAGAALMFLAIPLPWAMSLNW